ncbi:MAG: FAD-dependent oxidoreductase [Clostridia bacterium]|nr:FAD-dependent oxidoreductase [Clostridia bacterium]
MKKYGLIVVGGGLSGVAAAVSAARDGLSVLLIERMGCLGGAISNGLVYPFMKHSMKTPDGKIRMLSAGIFAEMCRRHRELGGVSERGWQPEFFKFVLDDMVSEAGVEVMFHTMLVGASVEGRSIRSVSVAGKAGVVELAADYFIDASGDGDLFTFAGCDYQLGRESDSLCQPMTTCFRLTGVDVPKFLAERPVLIEKYNQLQAEGKIQNPRENILCFKGLGKDTLHLNTTRVVKHDPTSTEELSHAEILARRQVLEMYNFLLEHSEACRDSIISTIADEIGVRESRKLKGVHILTGEELRSCTPFEDSIAVGNYDVDIHNPEGTGTYIYRFQPDEYFKIPYRSILPKEIDNLLVAGRCLSADHEAHSAVRIMPICACLGEAAGVAAALAHNSGRNMHTIDVSILRARLVEKGAEID